MLPLYAWTFKKSETKRLVKRKYVSSERRAAEHVAPVVAIHSINDHSIFLHPLSGPLCELLKPYSPQESACSLSVESSESNWFPLFKRVSVEPSTKCRRISEQFANYISEFSRGCEHWM